jgi:hypothetical protein
VRFSIIYDDVQAALAASANPDNAEKPLRGRDSDSDVDISNEKADELTEPAERLRLVRRQK